jgi:hypothetical protein
MNMKDNKKQAETEKIDLLGHFKAIIELSKHHAFGEALFEAAQPHLGAVRQKLTGCGTH